MKALLMLLFLSSMMVVNQPTSHQHTSLKSSEEVLQSMLDTLRSLKHVNYTYYRSVNYFSENYHNELAGSTYLDFRANQNVLGFKFQIESDTYKNIFDGVNSVFLNKQDKTMTISKQPQLNSFSSLSFFVNSIITLRRALPGIISDKELVNSIVDTTVDDKAYFVVSFTAKSKVMTNLGTFNSITSSRDITYRIFVDKSTYLPLQIIQTNSVEPKDYVLTKFSDYKVNTFSPSEATWSYITYAGDYKPIFKE